MKAPAQPDRIRCDKFSAPKKFPPAATSRRTSRYKSAEMASRCVREAGKRTKNALTRVGFVMHVLSRSSRGCRVPPSRLGFLRYDGGRRWNRDLLFVAREIGSMFILIILGYALCLGVGLLGAWVVLRALRGLEPLVFKGWGVHVEGSAGFVLILAALAAAVGFASLYTPSVEAENKQLTAENVRLQETKRERDDAQKFLREETYRADKLIVENSALKTDKDRIERDLAATRGDLSRTRAELTQTELLRGKETTRANDIAAKNEILTKQLGEQSAQRREAQAQANAAWKTADRIDLPIQQGIQFDQLQKDVLQLNADLTRLRINSTHWPRIEGHKAVATFEIYQRDFDVDKDSPRGAGLFDFNSEEYRIKSHPRPGFIRELRQKLASLICEAARRAKAQGISLREAVRSMPAINAYDINPEFLDELSEFQYVVTRLKLMAGTDSGLGTGLCRWRAWPMEARS